MTPRIAIVDTGRVAYAAGDLATRALGGTEATVLRVTQALAAEAEITVWQRARRGRAVGPSGVVYAGFGDLRALARAVRADVVIVLNSAKALGLWHRHGAPARLVLWSHNYPGRTMRGLGPTLAAAGAQVVAVSHTHARALAAYCARHGGVRVPIAVIHNPVVVGARRAADPGKLIFLSSPHKGIAQVLAAFAAVRGVAPGARLHLANPGYLPDAGLAPQPGLVALGQMPHAQVMAELAGSFCLFYPQTRFAETFGLVLAEANALGVPVIAQAGLGANDEIVGGGGQLLDCTDPGAVAARLAQWWRHGRPVPEARPEFALEAVAAAWRGLLGLRAVEAAPGAVPGAPCLSVAPGAAPQGGAGRGVSAQAPRRSTSMR